MNPILCLNANSIVKKIKILFAKASTVLDRCQELLFTWVPLFDWSIFIDLIKYYLILKMYLNIAVIVRNPHNWGFDLVVWTDLE